jgi:hypothetical protein
MRHSSPLDWGEAALARKLQRDPAGHEQLESRRGRQQRCHLRGCHQQMLEVV